MNMKFLNKKGITPIISVILLLMMTIAIAGLAYTWLQKMQTTISGSSEERSNVLLQNLQIDLRIDSYTYSCNSTYGNFSVYVRNAGSYAANNLQLYIEDAKVTDSQGSITSLAAGSSATLNATTANTYAVSTYNDTSTSFKVVSDESTAEKAYTTKCS